MTSKKKSSKSDEAAANLKAMETRVKAQEARITLQSKLLSILTVLLVISMGLIISHKDAFTAQKAKPDLDFIIEKLKLNKPDCPSCPTCSEADGGKGTMI